MASWSDLLGRGGQIGEQLLVWQVLGQLLGPLLGPMIDVLTQEINQAHPVAEISPVDAAEAVVRNFLSMAQGEAAAAKAGIDPERFATLKALAGDAPGPQQLAEALRREVIPEQGTGADSTSFVQGIAEGRLADKWAPTIKALATIWPTPNDALDALLEGQLDEETARHLYVKLGGDLQFFPWLFNTRGSAPTPMEAIEMANRGVIPWEGEGPGVTSYHQAFLEGPWRNKWERPFKELGRYIPPPRTIDALIHAGAVTDAKALEWFKASGMDDATAAAYLAAAHATKTTKAREIAESTVLTMYETHALTPAEASAHLASLGYQAADIPLVLEAVDLQREVAALHSATTRIGTLYVGRKISRQGALDGLRGLDVTQAHADHLMATWDAERASTVRLLTPAEVVDAWELGLSSQAEAQAELVGLGYTPRDAWLKLSIKAKAAQPHEPPPGPVGPGQIP